MSDFNTIGHCKERTLHVTAGGGDDTRALKVKYKIAYRYGADEGIAEATVKRWRFANYALANFDSWQKGDKWTVIEEFTNTALESHELARVLIFGDVHVLLDGKLQTFAVNTFTENTSAKELFEFVHMCLASSDGLDRIDDEMKRIDLEEYFPRRNGDGNGNEKPQPAQQSTTQPTMPPPADGHTSPHFGGYDYKKRESHYALAPDNTASFNIRRLVRKFDDRDGSPFAEVYSTYNGSLSKWPAHDLKVKRNRLEHLDDYSRGIIERALNGEEVIGEWRGVYFMFKPDDADRHYPVLSKLEPTGDTNLESQLVDQGMRNVDVPHQPGTVPPRKDDPDIPF